MKNQLYKHAGHNDLHAAHETENEAQGEFNFNEKHDSETQKSEKSDQVYDADEYLDIEPSI